MIHEWRTPTDQELALLRSAILNNLADYEAFSQQLNNIKVADDINAPPGFYLLPETQAPIASSVTRNGPISIGMYHDIDGRLVEILLMVEDGRLYSVDIQKLGPPAPIYQAPWDAKISFSLPK